ncbi:MAG: tRNA 2-selenouridine(34) synthase MnmH [Hyphomicrobiales bacterium]
MEVINTNEFLKLSKSIPIIDVRSPLEFEQGHIPGALNIPLFSNEEREIVGTTYKQVGKMKAIEQGLDFTGNKMKDIAIRGLKVSKRKSLLVHCWRGGMRSNSMAWLWNIMGVKCYLLEGGYKSYRNQLLQDFKSLDNLHILQGATGSGKTYIIHELERQGEQVIDLEKIANHKGSAFGELGERPQPTTQQFQNNLHTKLKSLDLDKRIWVEGESRTIGKVYLPETLWEKMNTSKVVEVNIPQEKRIQHLVKDYGKYNNEDLIKSVEKIQKRFGFDKAKTCIDYLKNSQYEEATKMLLDYYDKAYSFSREKYKTNTPKLFTFDNMNFEMITKHIIENT